jgi:hypothetical protein
VKSIDLEWIVHNWDNASEDDRLAAAKEMRKRLRTAMTTLEGIGRSLGPRRGNPATKLARVKELRAQGWDVKDAAAQARAEAADQPRWDIPDAAQMRQQIREGLDWLVGVIYDWAERCPDLEPAWTQLEGRALDLHTRLRLDDGEMTH